MDSLKRGRLLIVGAALCWSCGGAAVKLASSLNTWQIAGFRSLIAFVFVGLLVGIWNARPLVPSSTVMLGSIANAGMLILYIAANLWTTAANAIFLQCTAPVWVMLLSPWVLKEPFRAENLKYFVFYAVGMGLFFFDMPQSQSDSAKVLDQHGDMLGKILALLSGVCYAAVILFLRWGRSKSTDGATHKGPSDAEAIVVWGNLLCFIVCVPLMGSFANVTARPMAVVAGMGTIQLGLGYFLMSKGTAIVPALEAILIALVEPVLNPLWAFLTVDERPGRLALTGGAIVIGTVAFQTLQSRTTELKSEPAAPG